MVRQTKSRHWRKHPKNPAPDDDQPVLEGQMRCGYWKHVGPRILPATTMYFRKYRGKLGRTGTLAPECNECNRAQVKARDKATAPFRKWKQVVSRLSGKVSEILRGVSFAVPTRMPNGKLACSRCFQVKPFKKNFDMDNYRIEPVCLKCQKAIPA